MENKKLYNHVWASSRIYFNPEGYIGGQINGQWIYYDYSSCSFSSEKPNVYTQVSGLQYLGYLDDDSPCDQTYNYKLQESDW